jgi:hypothetical protein
VTLDEETVARSLKLDALKRFLKLRNWRLMECSNDTTLMYEGSLDDLNCPITLVLPAHTQFSDFQRVITKAVNLLAAVECCSTLELEKIINSLCFATANVDND